MEEPASGITLYWNELHRLAWEGSPLQELPDLSEGLRQGHLIRPVGRDTHLELIPDQRAFSIASLAHCDTKDYHIGLLIFCPCLWP